MSYTNYKRNRLSNNFVLLVVFVWFLFVARVLFAQPEILIDNLENALQGELLYRTGVDTVGIDTVLIEPKNGEKPYLGIVLGRDLNFEKARDLQYPYNYGAYVDELDEGGPADLAGLKEGDIITKFGRDKIRYNDHFINIVEKYSSGDAIPVIIFRDEKIMKTMIVPGSAPEEKYIKLDETDFTAEINFPPKKKCSIVKDRQSGIFSWDFIFYSPDNLDLYDEFLGTQLGYPALPVKRRINDKNYSGLDITGFHIKPGDQDGSIAWGFFWAGNNWNRQKQISYKSQDITRNMVHSINYWGFTLDKQIIIFNHILLSAGVLTGRLTSGLDFYQTEPLDSWNDIENQLSFGDQNYLSIEKKYLLFQPNVSLMIPVLGEIGVQIKFSYFYGIPQSNGWKVKSLNGDNSVFDSPNSSIGGYTVSFGPAIILN